MAVQWFIQNPFFYLKVVETKKVVQPNRHLLVAAKRQVVKKPLFSAD
jgi:hypothetical protein